VLSLMLHSLLRLVCSFNGQGQATMDLSLHRGLGPRALGITTSIRMIAVQFVDQSVCLAAPGVASTGMHQFRPTGAQRRHRNARSALGSLDDGADLTVGPSVVRP